MTLNSVVLTQAVITTMHVKFSYHHVVWFCTMVIRMEVCSPSWWRLLMLLMRRLQFCTQNCYVIKCLNMTKCCQTCMPCFQYTVSGKALKGVITWTMWLLRISPHLSVHTQLHKCIHIHTYTRTHTVYTHYNFSAHGTV